MDDYESDDYGFLFQTVLDVGNSDNTRDDSGSLKGVS